MRATIKTVVCVPAISLIASMATAGTAAADGYFEGVAGLSIPFGDDDWDDFSDESLKLGVRAGGGGGPTGLELSGDVTLVNPDSVIDDLPGDFGAQRFRVLIGARHRIKAGNATVFFRAGGGVDIFHYTASGELFGVEFERSETDPGLAAEVGGGFTVPVGNFYIGGQIGVPMAFHFDDDDPDDDEDADLEYSAYDIDLLFTIGMRQ
jgi:hypothetical protein